jgi:regulator of cell morphogenesis and NO signaling
MINAKQTIGEIAGRQPSTIEVFEQLGIQYCCHGEETIEETCRYLGLPVEGVLSELNHAIETNAAESAPWVDSILEALMGHLLRTSEDLIQYDLPRIQHLARSVGSCHHQEQPNAAEIARLTETLVRKIATHLSEEAHTLFPTIRELELAYVGEGLSTPRPDGVRRTVAHMVQEHDAIGRLLSEIQELTAGYNSTGTDCDPYQQLCKKLTDIDRELRLEVHLENNILFNRALRISEALYG